MRFLVLSVSAMKQDDCGFATVDCSAQLCNSVGYVTCKIYTVIDKVCVCVVIVKNQIRSYLIHIIWSSPPEISPILWF